MVELTQTQKEWLIDNNYIGKRTFDLVGNWKDYLLNQFQWFIEEEPFKEYDNETHLCYDLNSMVFIDKDYQDFALELKLFIDKEESQTLLSIE